MAYLPIFAAGNLHIPVPDSWDLSNKAWKYEDSWGTHFISSKDDKPRQSGSASSKKRVLLWQLSRKPRVWLYQSVSSCLMFPLHVYMSKIFPSPLWGTHLFAYICMCLYVFVSQKSKSVSYWDLVGSWAQRKREFLLGGSRYPQVPPWVSIGSPGKKINWI